MGPERQMKNLLNTEVVAGFVTSCRRCDFPLHIVAPCVFKGCNDVQRSATCHASAPRTPRWLCVAHLAGGVIVPLPWSRGTYRAPVQSRPKDMLGISWYIYASQITPCHTFVTPYHYKSHHYHTISMPYQYKSSEAVGRGLKPQRGHHQQHRQHRHPLHLYTS